MFSYAARRAAESIPLLLGISVAVFLVLQAVPGGPLAIYGNNPTMSPGDLARLREQLGLDKPWPAQYLAWLTSFVRGDWGASYFKHVPVADLVSQRLPNTLLLVGVGLALGLVLAVPAGVASALRRHSAVDTIVTGFSLVGISVPIFWSGLLVIVVFNQQLRWLPGGGMHTLGSELVGPDAVVDRLRHLVLPSTILALSFGGQYARYIRSSLLEVLQQDYMRTARAKGLTEVVILARHAFKNAAIPLVTIMALDIPLLFAGAVFTETIFSWPGMGQLFWESALNLDYPILMALMTITAVLVVFFNLMADVLYGLLDPRISYGRFTQ